jgi:hypothetical protein
MLIGVGDEEVMSTQGLDFVPLRDTRVRFRTLMTGICRNT